MYGVAVGTLAAQCAFFKGAARVVLIDREADRLQFAKDRIPKLETLNFANKKVPPSALFAHARQPVFCTNN